MISDAYLQNPTALPEVGRRFQVCRKQAGRTQTRIAAVPTPGRMRDEALTLLVSTALMLEYEMVLTRPKSLAEFGVP